MAADFRSVVLTGASTGIGRACALRLDREGWRVYACVRRAADGDALRDASSDRLRPLMLDVTDQDSILAAAGRVKQEVGEAGLHGLINNAGIVVAGPLEFLKAEHLRQQFEVNVFGQIAVTQAFLPFLRRTRGRIINVGSISARQLTPFVGAYGASKCAMAGLTDALRMELKAWGIPVVLIEPGAVRTPIWDKSRAAGEVMLEQFSDEAKELYGPAIEKLKTGISKVEQQAIAPEKVVRAVLHALTASRPKTRYIVGPEARIQAIATKILPDRVRDRVILGLLGIPSHP
ncbi:MAG: SDR family oxidoreductase [Candidatus Hydrogenedentes bacterium]|nr:SDR family oxidoreductase [Candidatus Hydrogenedentota bacterium]